MLAPNGARRMKTDHPAVPITIAETVATAKASYEAGAEALHAHVRDSHGNHSLDAGLYRELIREMAVSVPDMPVQITTESVGRFGPDAQREVVRSVKPEGVSVALREMWPEPGHDPDAELFYAWAADHGVAVQHILYTPQDAGRLVELVSKKKLPPGPQCLFVLGAYHPSKTGYPGDLRDFLKAIVHLDRPADWAVCAFGPAEIDCLVEAHRMGGKVRIGFENNLNQECGKLADDNASQVVKLISALASLQK